MTVPSVTDYLMNHRPEACVRMRIERGDYMYRPGDETFCIYLIEKGIVKIGSLGPLGERVVYDVLQPGEMFGDLDYLDEVEFFEFAQAATSLSLIAVDLAFFRHIIVHDPLVAEWFNETIIRRWYKAQSRLLHQARETVESQISRLSYQYGTPVSDAEGTIHTAFDLLSQQEIADLAGATRQTVSKKLNKHRQLV